MIDWRLEADRREAARDKSRPMTPDEIRAEVRARRVDGGAQWREEHMAAQVAANRRWRHTPIGRLLTKEGNARYWRKRKLREAAGAGAHHGLTSARRGPA